MRKKVKRMRSKEYKLLEEKAMELRAEAEENYRRGNYEKVLNVSDGKLLEADQILIAQWNISRKIEIAELYKNFIFDFKMMLHTYFHTEVSDNTLKTRYEKLIGDVDRELRAITYLQPHPDQCSYNDKEKKSIIFCYQLLRAQFYHTVRTFYINHKTKLGIYENDITKLYENEAWHINQAESYGKRHLYESFGNRQFDSGFSELENKWLQYVKFEFHN